MMNTKIFTLIFLTALLAVGMVSATVDFVDADGSELTILTTTVNQGEQTTLSFYLQEGGDGAMTAIAITSPMTLTSSTTSFDATLTTVSPTTLEEDTKSTIITTTFNILETQAIGVYTGELEVKGTYTSSPIPYTIPVSITVTQPPLPQEILDVRDIVIENINNELETKDDLEIKIKDIKVTEGFGKDEDWYAFDEVEIEIEIKNDNRNNKIKDIVVEWGLYDSSIDVNDWTDWNDEENEFNLKSKDDKTITLTLKLDDIDELTDGDYTFYVWANAEDENANTISTYDLKEISMQSEDDFIIIDDIKIVESVECDMDLQISADVWNIGEDEQEDFYIRIFNADLKLDKKIEFEDLDAYDDEKLDVTIQIPADALETSYPIEIRVYDEYDDIYKNTYDNGDEAIFTKYITVAGNCKVAPKATVTAALDSDAKSGKQLTIKSTIKNTGSEQQTYTLEAADYATWASLGDIAPRVVVLEAGETAEVLYKLNVNKDVSGAQTFNMVVKTGDTEKETMKQPVSVTIEESTGFSFPGLTGNSVQGDNWYLWGIGLLNVILIIIIIIVAIRVAKS